MNSIELDPANARRIDPMTRRASRYPFEHASPAVYAQSIEMPDNISRDDLFEMPDNISRDDLLHKIMVVICTLSIAGAVGIAIVEIWLRRVA